MNYNFEQLSTIYKNEIELKDCEIESLSKELSEINRQIKNEQERKKLLLLENQKIKEIYSLYQNKNKLMENKEENQKNVDNMNNNNLNIAKNDIKNKLLLRGCKFYNKINKTFNGDNKNLINVGILNNDNLNNNLNLLYDLENKFQLTEKNLFNHK